MAAAGTCSGAVSTPTTGTTPGTLRCVCIGRRRGLRGAIPGFTGGRALVFEGPDTEVVWWGERGTSMADDSDAAYIHFEDDESPSAEWARSTQSSTAQTSDRDSTSTAAH